MSGGDCIPREYTSARASQANRRIAVSGPIQVKFAQEGMPAVEYLRVLAHVYICKDTHTCPSLQAKQDIRRYKEQIKAMDVSGKEVTSTS